MIAVQIPQSDAIFNLPLFKLLDIHKLRAKQVWELMSPYIREHRWMGVWRFPGDTNSKLDRRLKNIPIHNTERLLLRGDV
jgi:hypothetical protein